MTSVDNGGLGRRPGAVMEAGGDSLAEVEAAEVVGYILNRLIISLFTDISDFWCQGEETYIPSREIQFFSGNMTGKHLKSVILPCEYYLNISSANIFSVSELWKTAHERRAFRLT